MPRQRQIWVRFCITRYYCYYNYYYYILSHTTATEKNEKSKCISVLLILYHFAAHYIHCQFVGSNPILSIYRCINIHLTVALLMEGGGVSTKVVKVNNDDRAY